MTKDQLIKFIEQKFKLSDQEIWDNCGIYNWNNIDIYQNINGVYICLDLTIEDINKAISLNCDVIITHHPLYIQEASKLTKSIFELINKKIELLKLNNIIHISLHTCFDRDSEGTSYQLAKYILKNENNIDIRKLENSYYSYYFELDNETSLEFFLQFLSHKKMFKTLRTPKEFLKKQVKKIGISSGSGVSDYYKYIESNIKIDCFLTGDVKWHNYIDAYELGVPIIDIGHDSEVIFVYFIYELLKELNIENVNKSENIIHVLEFI